MTVAISRGVARKKADRDGGLRRRGWRPISEYRKEMGYVVVLGDSGYISTPYQSAVAIYDDEFRPLDPWLDHGGDALSASGLKPEYFRTDLPKMD